MSYSFNVSNGVRQASVLSPYLFAVYMDNLSSELNKVNAGYIVGNLKLNHITGIFHLLYPPVIIPWYNKWKLFPVIIPWYNNPDRTSVV